MTFLHLPTVSEVDVRVICKYENSRLNHLLTEHFFSYHIQISNFTPNPIQLLKRFWLVQEPLIPHKTVEGDGVVGLQPIIVSGDSFAYSSYTIIQSEIGKMSGFYLFQQLNTETKFKTAIPEFLLEIPLRKN